MYVDPEKLEGEQTRDVLASAMDDLGSEIASVQFALEDVRQARTNHTVALRSLATSLGDLFDEFEALQRICAERLSA